LFAGFSLEMANFGDSLDTYYNSGKQICSNLGKTVQQSLKNYLDPNGVFDGDELEKDWFPQLNADVFISHSHQDEKSVIALAGWLNLNLGLSVFVDSCIWGCAADLLKQIDKAYCVLEKKGEHVTYDYDKRNCSTSHIHMMLSVALTKMIDRTECLIFYKSPNAIKVEKSITQGQTFSPWIYHEIQTSRVIQRVPPKRLHTIMHFDEKRDMPPVAHNIEHDHLIPLTMVDLQSCYVLHRENFKRNVLNILYEMMNVPGNYAYE